MSFTQQLTLLEESVAIAEVLPAHRVEYGEVFTKRWVVDLILDLVEYTPDRDLGRQVLVEPSCGTGAFLVPVVERLIESCQRYGHDLRLTGAAVRAFDLLDTNTDTTRRSTTTLLMAAGLSKSEAEVLAEQWITTDDFLLHRHDSKSADYVVGNPPYIRTENVPGPIMTAYRTICPSMRGRADVYVGFIEQGLRLLNKGGVLSFICADRWMRNQYGAELRELVTRDYAVDAVISMHNVDAFDNDVSAYPAVIVLRNQPQAAVSVIETRSSFGRLDAETLSPWIRGAKRKQVTTNYEATRVDGWFSGRDLWPSGTPSQLAVIADLEARFPPLEDAITGTKVGIGVATGCDDVFITDEPDLVEDDRLLPLLQAPDTTDGTVHWSGNYLVNPWDDQGLVDLTRYPRMAQHFDRFGERLRRRHVAMHRPSQWYRTIDRVQRNLLARPKLVLPDMKSAAHPVLDDGSYYPHHNLYYVVSNSWDPEVLGGILLSEIANLFVGAYCVKMRGGTFRFQAQYLRRIRVPALESLTATDRRDLAAAFDQRDAEAATAAALKIYGIEHLPAVQST